MNRSLANLDATTLTADESRSSSSSSDAPPALCHDRRHASLPTRDRKAARVMTLYVCEILGGDATLEIEADSDDDALAQATSWVREDDWMWDLDTFEITVDVAIGPLAGDVSRVHAIVVKRPTERDSAT